MPNLFNSIKLTKPNASSFDLSHDVKMSMQMGNLVPTVVIDCIPGDRFNIACDSLIRLAPLVSPVMHRIDVRQEYYFVPNRLLWNKWEQFITNNGNAEIGTALPAIPTIDVNKDTWGQLHDYMGIPQPPNPTPVTEKINALPFAAYQLIYREYYRDQNLVIETPYELEDGDNTSNGELTQMRHRAWEHDYFTSALPFAQKGADVLMPLSLQDAPIKRDTDPLLGDTAVVLTGTAVPSNTPQGTAVDYQLSSDPGALSGQLYADNSQITGQTSITDLRRATKLQEWLEKIARGGSRAIEVMRVFFGVKSSDQRLDRPEYIVGTKAPVIISEVLSMASNADHPQGNMAGHGVGVLTGKYGKYYCEEHGYIIGVMSIIPKPAYGQGIPKHFLKTLNPYQWYWPQFENIGEQSIENREIFAYTATGLDTFGYIPRYSEYKFMNNRVAGDFRNTLDFWTITRKFATMPALNQDFIEVDPELDYVNNIFAVTDPNEDKFYVQVLHKIRAIRLMSKYGTPMF